MTKLVIDVGTNTNDGTGDKLRDAMVKINDNFTELYGLTASETNIDFTPNTIEVTSTNGDLTLSPNGTGTLIVSSGAIFNYDEESDASAQLIVRDSIGSDMLTVDPLLKAVGINTTGASQGLFVAGNATITGTAIGLEANVSIGASSSNTVSIVGKIASSIQVNSSGSYDLGTSLAKFGTAHVTGIESVTGNITTLGSTTVTSETINGTYSTIGNLTLSSNQIDLPDDYLNVSAAIIATSYRGSVTRSALTANSTTLTAPLSSIYSYDPSANGKIIVLPAASANTGGMVRFINRSATYTYSVIGPDSALLGTISTSGKLAVGSDGSNWYVL